MRKFLWCGVLFAAAAALHADVSLPKIFGDNMMLQQGKTLPVWGKADPGEAVTVTFGDAKAETVTGSNGRFRVELPAQSVSKEPRVLTVSGKNKVEFKNVIVGNVWIASGQSNMEFRLQTAIRANEVIAKANYPEIRLFLLKKACAFEPKDDCEGVWQVCTPETVPPFSAVAFFFGRELYEKTGVPVGLIGTYWGGSNAKVWTSREVLAAKFPHYAKELADYIANQAQIERKYKEELYPKYQQDLKEWKEKNEADFLAKYAAYAETAKAARLAGKDPAEPPAMVRAPRAPEKPGPNMRISANLFNAMIAPIIPFAVTGAIWYQGEANAGQPGEYELLMNAMIADWRARFGQGDFPFYFVQLANFRKRDVNPPEDLSWAYVREAQSRSLATPNTGMAVAIDIGETHDIHPQNKLDVGKRLALWELKRLGQTVEYRGPVFAKSEIAGNKIVISFTQAAKLQTADGSAQVKGFAIAGADHKFVWADAKIVNGNQIEVSSPDVANPADVRYAFANNPEVNLQNEAGLPAEPFRTDSFNPANYR